MIPPSIVKLQEGDFDKAKTNPKTQRFWEESQIYYKVRNTHTPTHTQIL